MADAHFRVHVEKNHLRKLASADAIKALSELICNAVQYLRKTYDKYLIGIAEEHREELEIEASDA